MSDEASRLTRYDVGLDSYRAAKILMDRYGADAVAEAERRRQGFLDKCDEAGVAVWAGIAFAIGETQRGLRPGEAHN